MNPNRSFDHPFLDRDDLAREMADYEAWRARTRSAIEKAGELTEREAKQAGEAFARWRTADAALATARQAWHKAKVALNAVPARDVLVSSAGEPRVIERREYAALAAAERAAREAFETAEHEASRAQVSYTAVNAKVHAAAAERQRRAQAEANRRAYLANAERFGAIVDRDELERAYGSTKPNAESHALAQLAARRTAGR